MSGKFKEMLQASFKSNDTEEWLDVHFTRPIGLVFALFWNKLGVHPNVITILSIFLGIGAGICFYYTDLWHNVAGVLLLMFANFCDSTDGQMARLTGKKTLIGRMLDGFSGDVWFFCIYVALCMRMQNQPIPGMEQTWGIWIWVLGAIAGFLCHSPQSSLSDYYRNIHLFFLKGKSGSELDNSEQQRKVFEQMKADKDWLGCLFFYNYANYCRSQEKRTPKFQRFFQLYNEAQTAEASCAACEFHNRLEQQVDKVSLAGVQTKIVALAVYKQIFHAVGGIGAVIDHLTAAADCLSTVAFVPHDEETVVVDLDKMRIGRGFVILFHI